MSEWSGISFDALLLDSKDGEWGLGEEAVGHQLAEIIRGTDFSDLYELGKELPQRWVKDHLIERKKLMPGDLILETAGGTTTQSTGRVAIVRETFFRHHDQFPVLCASFSRHLRLNQEKYCAEFVCYLLKALYNSGYMAVYNLQHTGVSRFQYTTFKKKTKLRIPALPTQRKIAAILTAYDDLIANNQRRIALLERMAEAIYREWFVRLRFPGHETAKFEKGVPVGWELKKLEEICRIKGGKRLPEGHNLIDQKTSHPYIKGRDIRDGKINTTELQYVDDNTFDKIRNYTVKKGDVCITIVANIGDIGLVPDILDGANLTENAVKLTNFVDGVSTLYVTSTLMQRSYKEYMQLLAAGAAQSKLGIYKINAIKIWVPTQDLMELFESHVKPIKAEMECLQELIYRLKKIRDLLLPRLIAGKLSVEDLEIQFPPSLLAEA